MPSHISTQSSNTDGNVGNCTEDDFSTQLEASAAQCITLDSRLGRPLGAKKTITKKKHEQAHELSAKGIAKWQSA